MELATNPTLTEFMFNILGGFAILVVALFLIFAIWGE